MRSMLRRVPARDRPDNLADRPDLCFYRRAAVSARVYLSISGPPAPFFLRCRWSFAWTICANIAFVVCAFSMLLASNARLRHEAEDLALFDPLTNLPNRRFFQDRLLKAEQEACAANGLAVRRRLSGYGRLFKLVNDTLGHEAGDLLLRNISTAMALAPSGREIGLSSASAVGEFVVLLEDIEDRSELAEFAERLKAAVSRAPVSASARRVQAAELPLVSR